ncbi:MAG TPA: alpha/beta hydrolase [Nevskiaceae bacterium]|nr:alpha/beta hydrolase [Nevskiaceae bacterium]
MPRAARRPALKPASAGWLALRHRALWVEDHGPATAPPVLLLHGLGSSGQDWEFQWPALASRYRVLVPDFAGCGRSPPVGPFRIEACVADLCALLDRLGLAEVAVVGYSMGGAVAQQLALDHPQRVQRLLLTNTLPDFRPRGLRQQGMRALRLATMALLGPRVLARLMAPRLYPLPAQAALRAAQLDRSQDNHRRSYLALLWSLSRWSVAERLTALRQPVTLIAAEHDYFPPEALHAFAARLPNCRHCEIVPGTRHGLPREQPERFNRLLLDFLA